MGFNNNQNTDICRVKILDFFYNDNYYIFYSSIKIDEKVNLKNKIDYNMTVLNLESNKLNIQVYENSDFKVINTIFIIIYAITINIIIAFAFYILLIL